MRYKILVFLIFKLFVGICYSQEDSVVFFLTGAEMSNVSKGSVLSFAQPINNNSLYKEKIIDSSLEIRQIKTDFRADLYKKFLNKDISVDSFKNLINDYEIDTASLHEWSENRIVNILIKRLPNGFYEVAADINHSHTFNDEKKFIVKGSEECFINYETSFYFKGKGYKKKLLLIVQPDNINMPKLSGYEKKFRTVAGVKNILQGKVILSGDDYWINLTSSSKQLYFGNKDLLFSVGNKNEETVDFFGRNTILYNESDTVYIGDHLLKFKNVNINGDTIFFNYYGINKYNQGPNTGQKIKSIEGKEFATGEYKEISFKYITKKYSLLHFWGSWCGPCIENLPGIRTLFEKSGLNIFFVGLPYESKKDLGKSKNIITKYRLDWLQIIQLRDDPFYKADMVRELKINTFPTYIILDSNGVIIMRTSSFSEIENFFK